MWPYKSEAEWRTALILNGVATPEQVEKYLGKSTQATAITIYQLKERSGATETFDIVQRYDFDQMEMRNERDT